MEPLVASVLAKIDEQMERTEHLIGLIPQGTDEQYAPIAGAFPLGELLGHLLESMAGFCAVLWTVRREELGHFAALRERPVNHLCGPREAHERLEEYRARVHEGFGLLRDADLSARVPTIFVAEGEAVLTLLLGNLEHAINHKHQLFTCLKMLGVSVSSRDLYHFRGD
jgi:hypothetical protein